MLVALGVLAAFGAVTFGLCAVVDYVCDRLDRRN